MYGCTMVVPLGQLGSDLSQDHVLWIVTVQSSPLHGYSSTMSQCVGEE